MVDQKSMVSLRLSATARRLVEQLAERLGSTETGVVEMSIRKTGREEGLDTSEAATTTYEFREKRAGRPKK